MNKYEFYSGMQDGYPELKEIYEQKFSGSGVLGGALKKRKAHSRKRKVVKRSGSKRRVGGSKRRSTSKRSGSKRRVVRRATSKRSGSKRRVVRRAASKSRGHSKRRVGSGSKTRHVVHRRVVHRRPIGGSKRGSSGVKRTRAPSAYNMFVKKFLNHWKRDNPEDYQSMSQQDRMRVAAAEWRKQ